ALLIRKTGWNAGQLLRPGRARGAKTGPEGATVETATEPAVSVAAGRQARMADPTGAGDAFRAGFLAGLGHRLGHEGAARLGCAVGRLGVGASGEQGDAVPPATVPGRH